MQHRTKRIQICCTLGLLLALALTSACSAPAAPATPAEPTQPAPAAAPTQVPPTAAPVPTEPVEAPSEPSSAGGLAPATEACASLEPAMFKALGVEITTAEVPFTEPFSGKTGTACELSAHDTGTFFESVDVVMGALELIFESHGWTADRQYDADGPTGMGRGFRQGDVLAIASVNWEPSADANCPEDQPISACELTPEQQLYTVSICCVHDADGPVAGAIVPATEAGQGLEPAVFKALGVEVSGAEASFKDPLTDQPGTSYQLTAEGTGADFQSLDQVMGALELVFESHGWTPDDMYVADGPTGTARGFRLENALALAMVQWHPAPDSGCSNDMPISECDLAPEQILYTITIDCVEGL